MKYVQFHMSSANCHMTRAVYFLFAPWEDDNYIKDKRLVKYVNKDMTQIFGTHYL